jgi:hypothetical protein
MTDANITDAGTHFLGAALDKIESLQKGIDIMLQTRSRCQAKTAAGKTDSFPSGYFCWMFVFFRSAGGPKPIGQPVSRSPHGLLICGRSESQQKAFY